MILNQEAFLKSVQLRSLEVMAVKAKQTPEQEGADSQAISRTAAGLGENWGACISIEFPGNTDAANPCTMLLKVQSTTTYFLATEVENFVCPLTR